MGKNVLVMDHIGKSYAKHTALKDISLELREGEILGFLGPSGAGKTTTIKILTGQLSQTSGSATILGRDTQKIDQKIYEQIGIVTDNSGIYERLTVYDNLATFAEILNVDKGYINVLLKRVGLEKQKKQKAGKLSKGQGQRLVLARAVLHSPKILFLDEPTSGLDPATAGRIHSLLQELKAGGMAIFLTTHNMEEATKLCDHVALLNEGQIVEFGTPKEICLRHNDDKRYRIILDTQEERQLSHSDESLAVINQLWQENRIEALHSCEPTLENVFIKVTGRELSA
ncbi:ABC transporter ATP-binding protein [uncultured Vagococcus sp.]|uniref:ABC transporter ATP-binding protein n=1 Tax=uncultured Vagococcus sp. TaxID=189676 RepID=UPI0028D2046D|nr:ABC transporter ATP-binding protein [uncultured Vagococcus sp.]